MDCPGCAGSLEKQVNKIESIRFSEANWLKQELKIVLVKDSTLNESELEKSSMMQAKTQMVPVVLGYGITSGISIMARSVYVHKSYSNRNIVNSGMNDLYLLSKFRLFRKNTSKYTFGVAPFIASNVPIGSTEVSDRTWNPEMGLNISFRPRFFSMDLSTSFTFIDVA